MFEDLFKNAQEVIHKDILLEKLKSGRPLRIKHGWDPTGSLLHLGHSVVYRLVKTWQEHGHKFVFLIGDFTAKIGDPTGKEKTRPMLTEQQIGKNFQDVVPQLKKILDWRRAELRKNSEWLGKLKLSDFLKIASHISAPQLFDRDMFQERLKHGETFYVHEMLYPVLQGYDSVALKSDLTIVGTDQLFNELIGCELQKAYGQEPQAIITLPVLPGLDGQQKMSQSLNNFVGISEPATEQFGKLMSMPDGLIYVYTQLLTEIKPEALKQYSNPKEAKMKVAREIISWLWGEKQAQHSQMEFEKVFGEGKEPENIEEVRIMSHELRNGKIDILELLVKTKLSGSKSDARRLINEGAIEINGKLKKDWESVEILGKGLLIKKGKRHFVKVIK